MIRIFSGKHGNTYVKLYIKYSVPQKHPEAKYALRMFLLSFIFLSQIELPKLIKISVLLLEIFFTWIK